MATLNGYLTLLLLYVRVASNYLCGIYFPTNPDIIYVTGVYGIFVGFSYVLLYDLWDKNPTNPVNIAEFN